MKQEAMKQFGEVSVLRERKGMNMTKIKKTYLVLLAILQLVSAFGCQPTPKNEVVINRTDGTLERTVRATALNQYRYEVPDNWVETIEVRGQTVKIDAIVDIPDADRFPILTIQNAKFGTQQCMTTLEAIFGVPNGIREVEYSYKEILTDLQNAQKGTAVVDDETGEIHWVPYEGQQEEIERLESLLAEADAELDNVFIPLTEVRLDFPIVNRVIQLKDNEIVYIHGLPTFFSIRKHRSSIIQLENWVMQGEALPGEKRGQTLKNIRISEQEAIEEGNRLIARMGRDDLALASVERARTVEEYTFRTHGEGYYLTYVSCTEGGVPICYDNYMDSSVLYFTQESNTFAAGWRQERIYMFITEEGVQDFYWHDPKTVVTTANENVELIPFEQVQENFRLLLNYGLQADSNDAVLISRIVLGASIQQIPDQGDEAFLVPTWVIVLTTEQEQRLYMDPSVLLISALDGTYVTRW